MWNRLNWLIRISKHSDYFTNHSPIDPKMKTAKASIAHSQSLSTLHCNLFLLPSPFQGSCLPGRKWWVWPVTPCTGRTPHPNSTAKCWMGAFRCQTHTSVNPWGLPGLWGLMGNSKQAPGIPFLFCNSQRLSALVFSLSESLGSLTVPSIQGIRIFLTGLL